MTTVETTFKHQSTFMFRKGEELIPGYRLEAFLGRGQFGEVWRTTSPGRTSAALKLIDISGKQGLKEFRAVQRVKEIRHAHLMPITALWLLDAQGKPMEDRILDTYTGENKARTTLAVPELDATPAWLVVAMLLGQGSLLDRLEYYQQQGQTGIPVEELLRYMEEAAKGIDFLNTRQHDLGEGPVSIQHCDIKPANIMMVGDSVVICDFGLARVLTDAHATATGMVGSPAYMAPECIAKKPSSATDQYSLAITYVELRTGKLPFTDESYVAVLDSHRTGKLRLVDLPVAEATVIRRASAVNPADRFPTTREMVRALRQAAQPASEPAPRTRRAIWSAVGSIAVLTVAVVLAATNRSRFSPVNAPSTQIIQQVLRFIPPDARVRINQQNVGLDEQGQIELQLPSDQPIDVEVAASADFVPLQRKFSWEQLKQHEFVVELPFSGKYYLQRGKAQIAHGNRVDAVVEFKKALELDAVLAVLAADAQVSDHRASIGSIAVSRDSRFLAVGSDDKTVTVRALPLDNAARPIVLQGHEGFVDFVGFSGDHRWLVSASWKTVQLWPRVQLSNKGDSLSALHLKAHQGDVDVFTLSADGRWLATGGVDQTIQLWDLETQDPSVTHRQLNGHNEQIRAMSFSASGSDLISVCLDRQLIRWVLKPGDVPTPMALVKVPREVHCLKLVDQRQWCVIGMEEGVIEVRNLDGQLLHEPRIHGDDVTGLISDPKSNWLVSTGADNLVGVVDLKAENPWNKPLVLDRHTAAVVAATFSPDGDVLVTGSQDGDVILWNLRNSEPNQTPLRLASHPGKITSLLVSPDGRWLLSSCADGSVRCWDLAICRVMQEAIGKSEKSLESHLEARHLEARHRSLTVCVSTRITTVGHRGAIGFKNVDDRSLTIMEL